VNAGISVSRVGGAAQIRAMNKVAGRLRLDMAAFRSLAAFAQFGSDLDPATKAQLDRGQRLTEILKQGQYAPLPVQEEVASIWLATNGYLDNVPVEEVREFERSFLDYMRATGASVLERIQTEKWDDPLIADLKKVADDFKSGSKWAAAR
jgi:F-type H+-transporting ATPase subunit alpha